MEGSIDLPVAAGAALLAFASASVVVRERAEAVRARVEARLAEQTKAALLCAVRDLIAASRDSPQAVVRVLDDAIRACVAHVDAVAVLERRDDHLLCTYASGARLEHFLERAFALDGETACAQAARTGFRCIARRPQPVLHPSDRVSLAVPFVDGNDAFAVLTVGSKVDLPAPVVELIVALADQATPAFALALERAEDRRRATIDGLTGLLTPRAFRMRLRECVERARRDPRARLALLFVDADHFKAWNDVYGHASGDAVLRRLADVFRTHAHAGGDFCARNGGDEFCLIFAQAEKSEAVERARALRGAIAAQHWDADRPPDEAASVAITASIGVAAYPSDAQTADELLEKADAAMYHSKHGGRDRVSYYDDGVLISTPSEERLHDRASAR